MVRKTETLIELEKVSKSLDGHKVLDEMSFLVYRGETFILAGPSGAGKSVTLKHIVRLMEPDAGRVLVAGTDMASLDRIGLSKMRERFGVLFQSAGLLASMNVYDNVALPLRELSDFSEEEIREKVLDRLAIVGLRNVENKMPADLSGGMRKRVGLARAIIREPEIILYDEPTAGLDPVMAGTISELIKEMADVLGVTSVVVTHDLESISVTADRVGMLYEGRIRDSGTFEEMCASKDDIVRNFFTSAGPHKRSEN
jgi:phospholipid/cholesterol/gamma-HCH transport system ATP-binding protein